MELSRRGFLTGVIAVGAVAALPALASDMPILYGDGVHDDTAALQAFIDGKPVIRDGVVYRCDGDEPVVLHGGIYEISDTLVFDNSAKLAPLTFHGGEIRTSPDFSADYIFRFEGLVFG